MSTTSVTSTQMVDMVQPSKPSIENEIANSIVQSVGDRIPVYATKAKDMVEKKIRSIPIFDNLISKIENTNKSKLIIALIVLIVISYLVPFEILILINLFLTFIIVYKTQSKCIV